ncbi:hypothetical protein [Enterococcus gallinarum]|uniref:hypothetical protein n=1 Tax=Enterococcus gallinarum TaxID=1353 RepID=UPI00374E38AA
MESNRISEIYEALFKTLRELNATVSEVKMISSFFKDQVSTEISKKEETTKF